ncbi:Oidioi.mRNA.OKI2018_I69.chr1.g2344.t1.cds [Oikopleura dioica]|uniref:Oidioi.mRNA.OKI2018_I69.chr1.g2344.t1.cds n=1 Tax=Oikopleura dioica TaxID=34765 RepID=A0ABN7SW02_OIKDI|nr:Oidioi.mRNA.OKI2018_I69.chr1.g2344.t1.cds [Oikopleura dioica]
MGIAVENGTWQDFAAVGQRDRAALEYKKEHGLLAYPNTATPHQKYGYYNLRAPPQLYGYDYSYTLPGMCCNPGLSFENGRSTEPAETWVRLQPYPETTPEEKYSAGGNNFPNTGYFGPSGFEEEGTDPFSLNNYYDTWARQTIAGKNFDSRELEQEVSRKLENFIDENHKEPFFAYYGMKSGHAPFNTPLRFRNQTEAGLFGEMVLETDEIVGRILDKLDEHDIANDTLVLFMSDNGPTTVGKKIFNEWGHKQWRIDLPESPGGMKARSVDLQELDRQVKTLNLNIFSWQENSSIQTLGIQKHDG